MGYRWALPLALGLLTASALHPVQAQQAASLFLEPAATSVAPGGGQFDLQLMVDGITHEQGLGGYTLVMTYDPDIVRVVSVADTGFVESTGNVVICPDAAIDNEAGRVAHACFSVPVLPEPGPRVSAPQALAAVRLEPVAEGESQLAIDESELFLPDGRGLEVTTTPGRVTVAAGAATGDAAPPAEQTVAAAATATAAAAATQQSGGGLPPAGEGAGGGGNVWPFIGAGAGLLALGAAGAIAWQARRRRRSGSRTGTE